MVKNPYIASMNENDFFVKYNMPPYAMFAVMYNANKEGALNKKGCDGILKDLVSVYTAVDDQDKLMDLFAWLNPDIQAANKVNEEIKQRIGAAQDSESENETTGR